MGLKARPEDFLGKKIETRQTHSKHPTETFQTQFRHLPDKHQKISQLGAEKIGSTKIWTKKEVLGLKTFEIENITENVKWSINFGPRKNWVNKNFVQKNWVNKDYGQKNR